MFCGIKCHLKTLPLLAHAVHFSPFLTEICCIISAYSNRLDILGLCSLEEWRKRADLIEVFKIMKGLSSIPVDAFFELCKDGRTRVHTLKLAKHWSDEELRINFFIEWVHRKIQFCFKNVIFMPIFFSQKFLIFTLIMIELRKKCQKTAERCSCCI